MARLILASSSPRRRELLEQLGLVFDIYSPDIDESVQAGESVAIMWSDWHVPKLRQYSFNILMQL
jgi:predicted house-cleaning NTP pyrophosphatase (Maf/HAM1 superfamily)